MYVLLLVIYPPDSRIVAEPRSLLCKVSGIFFTYAQITLNFNTPASVIGHTETISKAIFSGLLHRMTVIFQSYCSFTCICSFGLLDSERHNGV